MTEVGNLKTQLEAEMSEKDKLAVKIQDKDKELDILGQQSNETNSTLMMNLNDKQKEMENLESKIADLTGDYTNASTKVKGLELENGSLTMNLNGQQTRIENLESKLADLTGDYANATTKVKELEIEGEKMQRKNEGVKADIAKMELNCDVRIADMIALLDKHKLRDEKKLEIKCKEVKDMAKKLEECKQKELANTGQIKNMQLKLKEAEQKELESKGLKEKCEQLEKCAERVKQLEGDVAVRDQEMKELLQAVKNMEQRRVVEPVTPVAQTPKRVSLPPTRRKTPQTPKTPVRDQEKMTQMKTTMSTPLAGILKNRSSSITRKRSVVFSEMDGADSSASEHMEVDYKEIQARFQVMQKGSASGSVRKTGFAYTRVPSTPQAMARESTAKQQQQQKKMKVSEEESKQFDTIFFPKENNGANINIKQQEQIAVNQQKTNNKFVKNSCKDRRRDFEKKGEIKKADLAWFETQDMFGFEAED
ncbi:PREDICTED: neurofilament medium polypeptide-like isoform X1 [Priapulus caudatus]|uniref:Neurofilament medium polypeptide-like isoform X1 n=1 Tax=Priapulus caudatus TaxID=37621 RepID=A0ABM1ET69_PRICU|nr:PREDICTED: neurofilament medium polypeptide-like isoform X1 [Priapulus caudatus]